MNDDDRQSWSRHYDTIGWAIMGLFAAGIGFLAKRSIDCDTTPEITNPAGILLSIAGLYYFAAFKRFRNTLHDSIENRELREILSSRASHPVSTWTWMAFIIAASNILFVTSWSAKTGIGIAAAVAGYLVVCFVFAALCDFGRGANAKNLTIEQPQAATRFFGGTHIPVSTMFSYLDSGRPLEDFLREHKDVRPWEAHWWIAEAERRIHASDGPELG